MYLLFLHKNLNNNQILLVCFQTYLITKILMAQNVLVTES